MRKILLLSVSLLLAVTTVFAEQRTVEEAATIASSFISGRTQAPLKSNRSVTRPVSTVRLAHRVMKPHSTEDALYVFNNGNEGFVIVSADDNAQTILGYSDEGAFDATNIPSNVQFWLDFVAERVAAAQPADKTSNIKKVRKATQATAISPLLGNIKWDQGTPYNNMCPIDPADNTRSYTGCVATAAAQIMKMYNWPATGQGSNTYNWTSDAGGSGTSTADFGATTYDWTNMKDSYKGSYTTTEANAVATLMFHVGVSCKMQYGGDASNGSGALTSDMGNALKNYFRYKNTLQYKSGLSTSQLTTLFNTELEAGRPILMGGSNNQGGHEFVCDGRDANGLFSINWGWGGTSNGYFALNGLDPDQQGAGGSSAGYNQQIDCVIGIQPDKDPVSVTGVTIEPKTLTLKIKETSPLTATVTPADASNKALGWSTSDASIATVSAAGVVRGVAPGTATITATTNDGGKTSTCAVTVTNEVALPTVLNVDAGYAEYDDQYDEPWTLYVYNSTASGNLPYIIFYPDGTATNKIAGSYTFSGTGGYLFNDPADPNNSYVAITSGQLTVTCTGKDNGSNGCNTYRILSYFTCEDGSDYKVDVTMEMCAQDADETAIDLADNVGDGQAFEATWMANGSLFAANIATNNKITLPADRPGNCDNGKAFVGWTKTENYEHATTAPTLAKTGDVISTNTTFYAVYGDATEGGAGSQTYTFTKKDWSATEGNWISGQAGAGYSNSGVQVTKNVTGANATAPQSFNGVTSIVVSYCTNGSSGAGTIVMEVNGTSVTQSVTKTGGTTARNLTFDFSTTKPTGAPKITVNCTTNSIYVCGLTINYNSVTYSNYSTSCGAVEAKILQSITLNTDNVKKEFTTGDTFTYSGLVVTATFKGETSGTTSTTVVTPTSVTAPDMTTAGTKAVYVDYEYGGVTKQNVYQITVSNPIQYNVTWVVDGIASTSKVNKGSALVLPSTPAACSNGKVFVGWTEQTSVSGNTAPSDLFTVAGTKTVTGDVVYRAVFATESTTAGVIGTLEASYSSHEGWTTTGVGTGGTGTNAYWLLKDGASITSPEIADLSTVSQVEFKIRTYGGSGFNKVNVSTSGGAEVGSATASNTTLTNKTITVSGLTGSGSLVFSSSTTSDANGPGINNIKITYSSASSTTYSDYTLTCDGGIAPVCTLAGISLNTDNVKKTYQVGDALDLTGLVVTANYKESVCDSKVVTNWTQGEVDMTTAGTKHVSINYSEGGVGASENIEITVNEIPQTTTYTVRWHSCAGVAQEQYSEGAALKLPTNPGNNGSKTFKGWITTEHYTGATAPSYISAGGAVNADADYYAVYGD